MKLVPFGGIILEFVWYIIQASDVVQLHVSTFRLHCFMSTLLLKIEVRSQPSRGYCRNLPHLSAWIILTQSQKQESGDSLMVPSQ